MATVEESGAAVKMKKQARLGLRLTEDQKARIECAATMTGQTLNSFVTSEMLRRSDEILEKEEVRRLSNRDRDIFLALLDGDQEPNEALKAAAEEYKKGRRVGAEYHFEL